MSKNPQPEWRARLVAWLRDQTRSPVRALKRFTTGGFVFAVGMMLILLAQSLIPPGLTQEGVALLGLCVLTIGGLYALTGYLAISVFRVLLYILEPKNE